MVVAALFVVAGVWIPWLVVEPGYTDPVPGSFVPGMEVGIAIQDYLVLALTAIGVATALVLPSRYRRVRLGGVVAAIAGLLLALFTLWWVVEMTESGDVGDVYVLGTGVYVTAVGGGLLTAAGGYQLLTGETA